MVNYTCAKCLKDFDRIDSYNKHLKRKYSCIPNDEPVIKLRKETEIKLEHQNQKIKELQEQMAQLLDNKTLSKGEQ